MILIADAGATKIQWVSLQDGLVSDPVETTGFNPYVMDPDILKNTVEKDLLPYINHEFVRQVYYYGAGCSTITKCGIVEDVLKPIFPQSDLEIMHDLLGAARALFGQREGIACILGTGSNSCLYDGSKIVENITSLGYFFGDEGSGAYLGKLMLTVFLRGEMPEHIRKAFDEEYGYSVENILDAVYNKPHPNRFLSSFSFFISEFREDAFMKELIRKNFEDFFTQQVTRYIHYQKKPLGVVGSVGLYYSDIFKEVASAHKLQVVKIIQSPLEGLIEYHRS